MTMRGKVRADRRAARRGIGGLAVLTMVLAVLVPVLELSGAPLGLALVAGVLATLFMAAYALSDAGTLTAAVLMGLVPTAIGEISASWPRFTAVAGGVLVFVAAELGQLALEQRSRIPIAADPPARDLRSMGAIASLGAAAGIVVLGLWLTHLPAAGVLAALGAVAVVLLAAVLAHPRAMLGTAVDEDLDTPDDPGGVPFSRPRAAPDAGR